MIGLKAESPLVVSILFLDYMDIDTSSTEWTHHTKKSQRNKQSKKGFGFRTSQTLKCCGSCQGTCKRDGTCRTLIKYEGLEPVDMLSLNKDKRWELIGKQDKMVKADHVKMVTSRNGDDVLIVKKELNRTNPLRDVDHQSDNKTHFVVMLPDKKRMFETRCSGQYRDSYGDRTKLQRDLIQSHQIDFIVDTVRRK
jgi:hypothetical protein